MQFLRTLFWIVLVVLAMLFAFANWTPVAVNLGDYVIETKLPVLLLLAFLVGLLPGVILSAATRWRMRRRLADAHRSFEEERAIAAAEPAPVPAPPIVSP